LADKGQAALDATLGSGGDGNWLDRYNADLKQQAARNVYDHVNRGIASGLGTAGGAGLALADGNVLGAETSAALPIKAKGLLGEALSMGKTIAKGDWPEATQVRRVMQNGKTTIVDHQTKSGLMVEAKFGPSARLSTNQRYAQNQWGPMYRVDRWLPRHVGYIGGAIGGATGLLSAGLQWLGDHSADGSYVGP
jgi:hypothetical protein